MSSEKGPGRKELGAFKELERTATLGSQRLTFTAPFKEQHSPHSPGPSGHLVGDITPSSPAGRPGVAPLKFLVGRLLQALGPHPGFHSTAVAGAT